ncbi:MAG TPA: hypothetical protein VM243_09545 [Phycisphaerae bacterium]|nr:hypothetical protein [Phycisphaerae bacterium]
MRKLISSVLVIAAAVVFCGGVSGCSDDVKKVETIEQTHESEPEMVSPGEMVVE